ncbi:MAG: response regulator transcription factor [Firmicutes bacterium]|nr:response regulator transcription factor [Bacillota bacterium]
MRTWNVMVCDDERSWLVLAEKMLREFAEDTGREIRVRCFEDPGEFLRETERLAPQICFMDIEFGGEEQGIDLAGIVNERCPSCQVAFLTNYLHYSLEVYRTEHIWYVLKPQFMERLPEIFQKLEYIEDTQRRELLISGLDGSLIKLPCEQILYMERQGRITRIETTSGPYETRMRIPTLEARLSAKSFVRCHNSYIVSLPRIRELRGKSVIMEGGAEILISRGYQSSFRRTYLAWAEDVSLV